MFSCGCGSCARCYALRCYLVGSTVSRGANVNHRRTEIQAMLATIYFFFLRIFAARSDKRALMSGWFAMSSAQCDGMEGGGGPGMDPRDAQGVGCLSVPCRTRPKKITVAKS
jgi:hypothetical protein